MGIASASPAHAASPTDRRDFLATLGCAAAPAASLLASGAAGAGKPLLIDTHVHVWADDHRRFPFAHPYEKDFKPPRLAGTVEMLVREMDTSGVSHCVLVQAIYHGWDNRYLAHYLKAHPR